MPPAIVLSICLKPSQILLVTPLRRESRTTKLGQLDRWVFGPLRSDQESCLIVRLLCIFDPAMFLLTDESLLGLQCPV